MSYTKLEFETEDLEELVNELIAQKKQNKLVYAVYKGYSLYSDRIDMDSAFMAVTGFTRDQYKEEQHRKKLRDEARKRFIEEVSADYINKGHEILEQDFWSIWEEIVPTRVADIYNGNDLDYSLAIIEQLNNGCEMSDAVSMLLNQEHSNMSRGMIRTTVSNMCRRGKEFEENSAWYW